MLVKHADIYTRESQSILEFRHAILDIISFSFSQMSAVHHSSKHTISVSDFTILTSGNSNFDLEYPNVF